MKKNNLISATIISLLTVSCSAPLQTTQQLIKTEPIIANNNITIGTKKLSEIEIAGLIAKKKKIKENLKFQTKGISQGSDTQLYGTYFGQPYSFSSATGYNEDAYKLAYPDIPNEWIPYNKSIGQPYSGFSHFLFFGYKEVCQLIPPSNFSLSSVSGSFFLNHLSLESRA